MKILSVALLLFCQFLRAELDCSLHLKSPIALNHYFVEEIMKLAPQKAKQIKKISAGVDGQDIVFWRGLPKGVQVIDGKELGVLRHYSNDIQEIIKSGGLRAGVRPYIYPLAHQRDLYVDLQGLFLTKPEFDPRRLWMGYSNKTPYIDLTLPEGLKVLRIEPGVYLIPSASYKPKWLRQAYQSYKESGKASASLQSYLEQQSQIYPFDLPVLFLELDFKGKNSSSVVKQIIFKND